MALSIEPAQATVPSTGGTSSHQLSNTGAARLAFKVKTSNNTDYRLKPVFGFVDAGATAQLDIIRTVSLG
jgi:hypothetical protein